MFENVGKKIKSVAKGYFITMTVIGVLTGIVLLIISFDSKYEELGVISGLLMMVVSPFVAWLSALKLYGFGEMVDTAIINRKSGTTAAASKPAQTKIASPATTKQAKQPAKKDPHISNPESSGCCDADKKQLERDITAYLGKKWCSACGEILDEKSVICSCGSKYLSVITQANVTNVLINLEDQGEKHSPKEPDSIPVCKCGAIPDRVGNQYVCPVCCRKFS